MSASEKLKTLRGHIDFEPHPEPWVDQLTDALPQLVAVVEAVEQLPEFFTTDDGRTHSVVPLLDALDEALGSESEVIRGMRGYIEDKQMGRNP